jgi:iron complex transport system ATP-binding protein
MLEVRNVCVSYSERTVLRDISFELAPGEVIVLLGANGVGKSTLIRALNLSMPTSAGEIIIDGISLRSMTRREIAKRIAVVAQENETKFPVTVQEFVLAGRFVNGTAFGWESVEDHKAADKALAECDPLEFRDRLMNELSGGERQRVVLARAIATNATIFLLDEPTANLDLAHQASMFGLIRKRCRDNGCSAVVITHDLNLAAEFGDRAIMLSDERICAIGTPAEIFTRENLRKVYGVDVVLDANPSSNKVRVTTIY